MNDSIFEKISRGEALTIEVRGASDKLDSLMGWLQQFKRRDCGDSRQCLNLNRHTPFGKEQLIRIEFGEIPDDKRRLLVGTLNTLLIASESPNEFTLK